MRFRDYCEKHGVEQTSLVMACTNCGTSFIPHDGTPTNEQGEVFCENGICEAMADVPPVITIKEIDETDFSSMSEFLDTREERK